MRYRPEVKPGGSIIKTASGTFYARAGHRIRGVLLALSLLAVTVAIPLFALTYFTPWYQVNCRWHHRCAHLGSEAASARTRELVGFFRHSGELPAAHWTAKEIRHLAEVRGIFDILAIGAAASTLLLIALRDRRRVRRAAIRNAVIVVSAAAVLPFFRYFWRHIFHRLLFDNAYWLNTPADTSYYITPRTFFFNSAAFLIAATAILNVGLFLLLRRPVEEK